VSVMWWLLVTSLVLVTVESVSAESVRRSDDPLRADCSRRTVLPLGALMIGSVGALTGAAFLLYPPALAVLLLGTAGGVLAVTILGCGVALAPPCREHCAFIVITAAQLPRVPTLVQVVAPRALRLVAEHPLGLGTRNSGSVHARQRTDLDGVAVVLADECREVPAADIVR